jgi:hypothetical protein
MITNKDLDLVPFPTSWEITTERNTYDYDKNDLSTLTDSELANLLKKNQEAYRKLRSEVSRRDDDEETGKLVSDYPIFRIETELKNTEEAIEKIVEEIDRRSGKN